MPPRTQTVLIEQFVQAPPEQVYRLFTNATALREWLCDLATVSPQRGGRIYLWWNGNFYSSGEYTDLVPDQKVAFTWLGRGDPGPSHITVNLASQGDGCRVSLLHKVPTAKKWQGMAEGFAKEWTSSLENLASVLETGKDLRIFNRPMLGILLGDYNAEHAARLGVPVTQGLRLDSTVEGMGAYAAGLRKDDVLVSLAGRPITNDFASLPAALQGKKGGDTVKVVFYRGAEKMTVDMELSRRPVPDIPFEAKELARRVQKIYADCLDALEQVFAGVTEEQAARQPAPGEWSAKEVLAHLLLGERGQAQFFSEVLQGQQRSYDDFGGNDLVLHAAIANSYTSYKAMFAELRRLSAELVAFVAAFPPEYLARKGSYFNVAYAMLNGNLHIQSHQAQIEQALKAAGKEP